VVTLGFESLILFVSDLEASRAFYVDGLGLPVVFEDGLSSPGLGRARRGWPICARFSQSRGVQYRSGARTAQTLSLTARPNPQFWLASLSHLGTSEPRPR
jgi:catechol 2,3-dioxygenase-like lactoylglutathione lyase family enzyme